MTHSPLADATISPDEGGSSDSDGDPDAAHHNPPKTDNHPYDDDHLDYYNSDEDEEEEEEEASDDELGEGTTQDLSTASVEMGADSSFKELDHQNTLRKAAPARPNSLFFDSQMTESLIGRIRSKSALNQQPWNDHDSDSSGTASVPRATTRKRTPSIPMDANNPLAFNPTESELQRPASPLPSKKATLELKSKSPSIPSPKRDAEAASMHSSTSTGNTSTENSVKKKPSYFQKLGFGQKSAKVSQLQPSNSQQIGFKLSRRGQPGSARPSIADGEADEDDDNSQYAGYGRKGRKATNAGYINVKAKNKNHVELSRLKKVQLITANSSGVHNVPLPSAVAQGALPFVAAPNDPDHPHIPVSGSILAMKFSNGGQFLATAGADCILRVWIVCGKSINLPSDVPLSPRPSNISDFSKNPTKNLNVKTVPNLASKRSSTSLAKTEAPEIPPAPSLDKQHTSNLPHYTQIISPVAHRTYHGHTAAILDLAWSKSNFVATASADKTVRLWHLRSAPCLKVFVHDTPVSAVRFHPTDDHHFISGGGSTSHARLRLWSISERRVKHWVLLSRSTSTIPTASTASNIPESAAVNAGSANVPGSASYTPFITALEFSLDGSLVITGTTEGSLYFHEFNELKYNTRVDLVPMSNSRSFRVTGIESLSSGFGKTFGSSAHDDAGEDAGSGYILVTATDSRVRLFNLRDKSLVRRYRGPDIRTMGCMRAVASQDGRFAICGSEDSRVYMWDLDPNSSSNVSSAAMAINTIRAGGPVGPTVALAYGKSFEDKEGEFSTAAGVVTAVGGKSSLSGVISGLMHWDQNRFGQYERFAGADCSISNAIFAPPVIRTVLGLETASGSGHLAGAFIFVTDMMGNIHIYENELPFWHQQQQQHMNKGAVPDVQVETVASLDFASDLTRTKSLSRGVGRSLSEKRKFPAPPIQTDLLLVAPPNLDETSPSISPTIDGLSLRRRKNNVDSSAALENVFGTSAKDIYFRAKVSTAKERPPISAVPAVLISPTTDGSLGVPMSPRSPSSRRRSYSTGPLLNNNSPDLPNSLSRSITRTNTISDTFTTGSTATPSLSNALSAANIKTSFLESLKMRTHAKSTSAKPPVPDTANATVSTTAALNVPSGAPGVTAPGSAPAPGLISGLLTRIRGNTVDAHTRPTPNEATSSQPATSISQNRLSPTKAITVPLKSNPTLDTGTSPNKLASKRSQDNLRRGAFQSAHSLITEGPPSVGANSLPQSPSTSHGNLFVSLPRKLASKETADGVEVEREEELYGCIACGGDKFSVTTGRKLVCVDCHYKMDL